MLVVRGWPAIPTPVPDAPSSPCQRRRARSRAARPGFASRSTLSPLLGAHCRPIFPSETGDTLEFAYVGRHERRAKPPSLPREKDVVGPDWLPVGLEFGPHRPRLSRVLVIEQRPLQWPGAERLQSLRVEFLVPALGDCVPEFERRHRGQQDRGVPGDGALKTPPNLPGGAVDQRDTRVRIKEVARHQNMSRTGATGW